MRRLFLMDAPDNRMACYAAIIAFVAGGANALRSKRATWREIVVGSITSMVTGYTVACVLAYYACPVQLTYAAASLAGWIGSNLLDLAGVEALRRVRRHIMGSPSREEDGDEKPEKPK
jgi:hypothetical protein